MTFSENKLVFIFSLLGYIFLLGFAFNSTLQYVYEKFKLFVNDMHSHYYTTDIRIRYCFIKMVLASIIFANAILDFFFRKLL